MDVYWINNFSYFRVYKCEFHVFNVIKVLFANIKILQNIRTFFLNFKLPLFKPIQSMYYPFLCRSHYKGLKYS